MKDLICPKCNSEMLFDDSDFEFPGCGVVQYICSNPNCECSCVDVIRFNKVIRREWFWDDDIQETEYFNTSNLDGGEF